MRIKAAGEEFGITFTREELVIIISALGWTDSLVSSDEAFQEYVGWPREKFRALVGEIADTVRSSSA